jgi:hypothetical protein
MLVQCQCRSEMCRRSLISRKVLAFTLRFLCPRCRRRVPWCFGAADSRPELCDDCWAEGTD